MKTLLEINANWTTPVIIIVGVIVLFMVCREVVCWYFKINELKKNQERTNYLLVKILVQNGGVLDEEDKEALK